MITCLIYEIVDSEYSMCTLVVGAGNGPESLLASRVPNLQFHNIPINSQ